MLNKENKLTADDLIVEYMVYKVNNGYEPRFTGREFMDFLNYFESRREVNDVIFDSSKLFERFFKRKLENDWDGYSNDEIVNKLDMAHMNIEFDEKEKDYVISANYKLNYYDMTTLNTFYIDSGKGKFLDYKGEAYKVRSIIKDYLKFMPKRSINTDIDINYEDEKIGKYFAFKIVNDVWNSYVDSKVLEHRYPSQCRDIKKYLIDMDLCEIIGVLSIKDNLFRLYKDVSERVAVLYSKDKNLKLSTNDNEYLARSNYNTVFMGYSNFVGIAYKNYDKPITFDFSENKIGELNYKNVNKKEKENVKKLIKRIDSDL